MFDGLNKFYGFSTFQLLYNMTLAIKKQMGVTLVRQHIMNSCQEDYGNVVLATGGTPNSSNKTESLSYKGKCIAIHLK